MQTKVDILRGEKEWQATDCRALHNDLFAEYVHLNDDNLKELIYTAKVLRARQGGSPVPVRDERPAGAELGPGTTWTPDKPPAAFDGSTGIRPLGDSRANSMTVIEAIVETLDFDCLIDVSRVLKVPCDFGFWQDDEWPDKEDQLRVAVAEAMEKL